MPEPNIIPFPQAASPVPESASTTQGELFRSERLGQGHVAFVSLDHLTQEGFFQILAQNTVRTVVDIRTRPVFCRPRYIHSNVIRHLFARKISYIECAMLSMYEQSGDVPTLRNPRPLLTALDKAMSCGLVLFVYDKNARAAGLVDSIQGVVRSISPPAVEILLRPFR